jgi:hypothetical protein
MAEIVRLTRNWRNSLAQLVQSARRHLFITSPFVSVEGSRLVARNVGEEFRANGRITFLTNLSVSNLCQAATDPRAIPPLTELVRQSTVYHLPGLHAKVYIADRSRAIVTSGNLTAGGLYRNVEYGIELSGRDIVSRIRDDFVELAGLGAIVPPPQIARCCDAAERLYANSRERRREAESELYRKMRDSLRPLEDSLIGLRLADGPIHTVFARTIEYLLRMHGPLTTVDLHPRIAGMHPDLCDDTVDRVIDGKRFGKKWKHAVRTAQQQLKKAGKVNYAEGRWQLKD